MISDPVARYSIAEQWATVIKLAAHDAFQRMTPGGVLINYGPPPGGYYNLPLILAYCVLDEFLTAAIGEGVFSAPAAAMLGRKMHASLPNVTWLDFGGVDLGREKRNDVAHKGLLLDRDECRRIVALVGQELAGWGLVSQAV